MGVEPWLSLLGDRLAMGTGNTATTGETDGPTRNQLRSKEYVGSILISRSPKEASWYYGGGFLVELPATRGLVPSSTTSPIGLVPLSLVSTRSQGTHMHVI